MTSFRLEGRGIRIAGMVAGILMCPLPMIGNPQPQTQAADGPNAADRQSQGAAAATIDALDSFVDLRKSLLNEIEEVNRELAATESDAEKKDLKSQLDKLDGAVARVE